MVNSSFTFNYYRNYLAMATDRVLNCRLRREGCAVRSRTLFAGYARAGSSRNDRGQHGHGWS